MLPEHWNTFDKLRRLPIDRMEDLAEYCRKEGIRFTAPALVPWGQYLSTKFGDRAGLFQVPEWLAAVISKLASAASPKSICDPWAGVGLLLEVIRNASGAKTAIAFTTHQSECALGGALLPEIDWHISDPFSLPSTTPHQFDLVASVLPMGIQKAPATTVTTARGTSVELRDHLGNRILVASALRLTPEGVGLFVVTPSFFFSEKSVLHQFQDLGLGLHAALALPSGTFAPHTNIPTYLLIVRKTTAAQMFVAQLSRDEKANQQILDNLQHHRMATTLELGRMVDPASFISFENLRMSDLLKEAGKRFGVPPIRLADIAISINPGRPGDVFAFEAIENAIYVPMIGNSNVVDSLDTLVLKRQNYTQVVIDSTRSSARFVARFLNSDFGNELLRQSKIGSTIPRLNGHTLGDLPVFVPDLPTQQTVLEVEAHITDEQTTLLGLQNELSEYRRVLWSEPRAASSVARRLAGLSNQLSGGLRAHAAASLEQWFETLPFPLASILRAWQASPSRDFKTKCDHLLHFFEATTEFLGIILLSAFHSNEGFFDIHKQALARAMDGQKLSFHRATFGLWKIVVEYLGKQTRLLLSDSGKKPEKAQGDRTVCADLFSDESLELPQAMSRKELGAILSKTNTYRNDWLGHSGIVGSADAQGRNEQLLAEVQSLREVLSDTWADVQLVRALQCRPHSGVFDNEVSILMGSNSEFLKDTRSMSTWLDVERLYLVKKEARRGLKLLPLVQVGPSPESAKNACYFFSRMDSGTPRFVSYHFTDQPELKGQFKEAVDAINSLTQV